MEMVGNTRIKIVAGNWKMNLSLEEATQLTSQVIAGIKDRLRRYADLFRQLKIILAPPFPYIYPVSKTVDDELKDIVHISAQNCHWKEKGPYTGEVSTSMIRSAGASWVIIGHSERRQPPINESDELLRLKVQAAVSSKIKVIFCCGETEDEYLRAHSQHVVRRQIINALFTLEPEQFKYVAIAYEPVWAIGTGRTASPQYAQQMHRMIRQEIARRYGDQLAESTPILYGGSIKPENAFGLFNQPDIDGGLVGGSSLNAEDFLSIIDAMLRCLGTIR